MAETRLPSRTRSFSVVTSAVALDGAGCWRAAFEVGGGVAVVVGKGEAGSDEQAGGFKAGKELFRAGDAAEGGDGAVDGGDFHVAMQTPDGALPAPGAQFGFELGIVGGNGDDGGAMGAHGAVRADCRRGEAVSCQSSRLRSRMSMSR